MNYIICITFHCCSCCQYYIPVPIFERLPLCHVNRWLGPFLFPPSQTREVERIFLSWEQCLIVHTRTNKNHLWQIGEPNWVILGQQQRDRLTCLGNLITAYFLKNATQLVVDQRMLNLWMRVPSRKAGNNLNCLILLFLHWAKGRGGSPRGKPVSNQLGPWGHCSVIPFGECLNQSCELLSLSKGHCFFGINRNH